MLVLVSIQFLLLIRLSNGIRISNTLYLYLLGFPLFTGIFFKDTGIPGCLQYTGMIGIPLKPLLSIQFPFTYSFMYYIYQKEKNISYLLS